MRSVTTELSGESEAQLALRKEEVLMGEVILNGREGAAIVRRVNAPLERTSLYDIHRALGGRLVPFAGWAMPVQYEGVVAEHHAVRSAAGLFDVSHMGELRLRGPRALEVVDGLVTNAVSNLAVGRARYTVACNEAGGILEDLIVYRVGEEEVLVVINAANRQKMTPHFEQAAKGVVDFEDATDATALLALQGPKAVKVAEAAGASSEMLELRPFSVATATLGDVEVLAARTGYTGEDGFELFCAWQDAPRLWAHLSEVGGPHGLMPAGLGARDTLRLEACLSLYGHELSEEVDPFEAGLGWVVKLEHGDFRGRDALIRKREAGPSRKLVGLEMIERGIARAECPILNEAGETVGVVTSGSPGPTVGKNIGLGFVPVGLSEPGAVVTIQIRGKTARACVVPTPFYKRSR